MLFFLLLLLLLRQSPRLNLCMKLLEEARLCNLHMQHSAFPAAAVELNGNGRKRDGVSSRNELKEKKGDGVCALKTFSANAEVSDPGVENPPTMYQTGIKVM